MTTGHNMTTGMVDIEIDGRKVPARIGAMLIDVADEAGIPIPRFCYHKKLSIAANCRMCLVEVEKAGKPLPACATPISEGMKVFTKSARAIDAQKGVMEFLLINHPLDCPICDQGGECELQDLAMGYGGSQSRFQEKKRVVADKNIGPLISTDMTRCIHCTRCVRFGQEIGGIKELGVTGRGEHMQIGTYIERSVNSEMSGNMIDLCPVGALTSKPFRYSARAWEIQARPSIAAHDCIGSNIEVHVKGPRVKRVVPRENEVINETWLSDRDRFAYEGLNCDQRLQKPRIFRNGKWEDVAWDVALEFAVNGLKKIVTQHGAGQLGALASPNNTVEEIYLLQKFMRGMGSANIDHRLWQRDFTEQDAAPHYPWLGQSVEALERLNSVLLVGSNIRKDQPIAAHRLRKATGFGAKVMAINTADYGFHFPLTHNVITDVAGMVKKLAGVWKAALKEKGARAPEGADKLLADVSTDGLLPIAKQLLQGDRRAILLGIGAMRHPAFATLRVIASQLAELTGAKLGYLSLGANSAGAWLAGGVPHRGPGAKGVSYGLHARAMAESPLKGYVVLGVEPEIDSAVAQQAVQALSGADFVVAMSSYFTDTMADYADVVLPVAPFSETSGTFVSAEGRWQSFAAVVEPLGQTRPAWKVLRVLGNHFGIAGFEFMSSEEVRGEARHAIGEIHIDNHTAWRCPASLDVAVAERGVVLDIPAYQVDAVVRRAAALQHTVDGRAGAASLAGDVKQAS